MSRRTLPLNRAAQCFAAVGSEPRLKVLQLLVRADCGGLAIGEIQARLGIAASTLAHHLRLLADAGLVEQQKTGRTVINRARYGRLSALADFLLRECCADAHCETTSGKGACVE